MSGQLHMRQAERVVLSVPQKDGQWPYFGLIPPKARDVRIYYRLRHDSTATTTLRLDRGVIAAISLFRSYNNYTSVANVK